MRSAIVCSLFLALGVPVVASAAPVKAQAQQELHLDPLQVRSIVKGAQQQRLQGIRANARFFSKITQGKDWRGEHVVHSDAKVTAFLDMSDPAHPGYDRTRVDEDETISKIPEARRAHILVVPNAPREHIGKSVTGVITLDDINETKEVLESAHKVAKDLGIKNPRIYLNTSDRLMVGYLHVHIVGERDGRPYPKLAQ